MAAAGNEGATAATSSLNNNRYAGSSYGGGMGMGGYGMGMGGYGMGMGGYGMGMGGYGMGMGMGMGNG